MTQIVVRTIEGESDTLNWILTDHLSSASVIANADGTLYSEVKYTAFGEIRSGSEDMPTKYQYTGQLSQMAEIGLYHYGARFYDPSIMMFVSPDTLIPDPYNPLDWNRYIYARANPIRYNDPSGHVVACDRDDWACQTHWDDPVVKEEPYVPEPLDPVIEFVATVVFEPLDWAIMADSCLKGDCNPWFLLGMVPFIPGNVGKYANDIVELVPARKLHWSQKAISQATKDGLLLDDLAQSVAQGWKGNPLIVLDIDGKLVSLDNRRLTVAKMLDIDIPVTISKGHAIHELQEIFYRDGIFSQIHIRGTQMVIDMFGRLLGR